MKKVWNAPNVQELTIQDTTCNDGWYEGWKCGRPQRPQRPQNPCNPCPPCPPKDDCCPEDETSSC